MDIFLTFVFCLQHSLRLQKKAFDRTITELEKKASEEAPTNAVLEKLGDLVQEREGLQRKLSTTYSLGRDALTGLQRKTLLPLYDGKTRSYSFQGARKESVTIFHTVSDASSGGSDSDSDSDTEISWHSFEEKESAAKAKAKAKAKAPITDGSFSDDEISEEDYQGSSSEPASSSRSSMSPLNMLHGEST